eukprot:964142-Pleurochrysis_carterae.AAC.1
MAKLSSSYLIDATTQPRHCGGSLWQGVQERKAQRSMRAEHTPSAPLAVHARSSLDEMFA